MNKTLRLIELGTQLAQAEIDCAQALVDKDVVKFGQLFSLTSQLKADMSILIYASDGFRYTELRQGEYIVEGGL